MSTLLRLRIEQISQQAACAGQGLPPTHIFSDLTASLSPQDRVDFLQLMIDSQDSQDSSKSDETDLYKSMSRSVLLSSESRVVPCMVRGNRRGV